MTAANGIKVEVRVDETLEAVAMVLRDLRAEFEEQLSQITTDGSAQQESHLSQLARVTRDIDALAERALRDRRELDAQMKELRQQIVASVDKQRETNEGRAATLDVTLEVLRKKINESEKIGQGAVEIARTTQESMLRLAEEAQEAMKPLAEGVDDARAQHQRMMAELAELDAKALVKKDLDDLRSWVTGLSDPMLRLIEEAREAMEPLSDGVEDARVQHRKAMAELAELEAKALVKEDLDGLRAWVTSLSDPMAEKITVLCERYDQLRDNEQEIRKLFQDLAEDVEAHTAKRQEFQSEIHPILERLAAKKDVEALQELLGETAARTADAVDFSEKAAVEAEQALEKHRERVATAIEALRDTFSDRQEQLRDQMQGMRDEIFADLDKDLRALVELLAKDSNRMLVEQAERFIGKLSENIKGERGPAGQVSRVQQWVADYQFPELALVRHRAGLWQALRDTMEEPGSSGSDWQLIAAGVLAMEVAPDEACPGQYRLIVRDSDDRRHEIDFHVPLPTFHKTWNADHEYRHYDSVMEDGHRWLAVKDAPTGPPSRSEDWVLLGMRGGRGARGAKGNTGPAGPAPDMEEILDAYDRRRLEANGTPVSSFRGAWRFGANYAVGDFVRGPGVMALCREEHRAENPPTGTNAQWEILFDLPDSGVEGGPRPQELQAQIAALTAQVQALTGTG